MDPLDHLIALPDGLRCSVCDERVPETRIRLLARRDDLAFLEIDCGACLSTTLGFVLGGQSGDSAALEAPPVSSDDVLDMHQLLASWRGDLTGLLAPDRTAPDRTAPDRTAAQPRDELAGGHSFPSESSR